MGSFNKKLIIFLLNTSLKHLKLQHTNSITLENNFLFI